MSAGEEDAVVVAGTTYHDREADETDVSPGVSACTAGSVHPAHARTFQKPC